jgi:hypothetical protein
MANNGHLLSGVCVPKVEYNYQLCLSTYQTGFVSFVNWDSSAQFSNSGCGVLRNGSWSYYSTTKTYDCQISGPQLTANEQIQYANIVFAAILVALCVIWGAKQLYQTLISNPRTE